MKDPSLTTTAASMLSLELVLKARKQIDLKTSTTTSILLGYFNLLRENARFLVSKKYSTTNRLIKPVATRLFMPSILKLVTVFVN